MLTVKFQTGAEALRAYAALGVEGAPSGSNFVMYDSDEPVALMRTRVVFEDGGAVCEIDRLHVLDGVSDEDVTFFEHAMFYKFIGAAPIKLRLMFSDASFEKFGFVDKGDVMEIISSDINLYYNCGGDRIHG